MKGWPRLQADPQRAKWPQSRPCRRRLELWIFLQAFRSHNLSSSPTNHLAASSTQELVVPLTLRCPLRNDKRQLSKFLLLNHDCASAFSRHSDTMREQELAPNVDQCMCHAFEANVCSQGSLCICNQPGMHLHRDMNSAFDGLPRTRTVRERRNVVLSENAVLEINWLFDFSPETRFKYANQRCIPYHVANELSPPGRAHRF